MLEVGTCLPHQPSPVSLWGSLNPELPDHSPPPGMPTHPPELLRSCGASTGCGMLSAGRPWRGATARCSPTEVPCRRSLPSLPLLLGGLLALGQEPDVAGWHSSSPQRPRLACDNCVTAPTHRAARSLVFPPSGRKMVNPCSALDSLAPSEALLPALTSGASWGVGLTQSASAPRTSQSDPTRERETQPAFGI